MLVSELNQRSRTIFRQIVDAYLETGEPIGSRTLSKRLSANASLAFGAVSGLSQGLNLSPATIRNVMADLEEAGLLFAPHTSAGRLPTELGLRLFVDGLLRIGDLPEEERRNLSEQFAGSASSIEGLLEKATTTLSGLSHCAGLVMAPKNDGPLKHIEIVNLNPGRALVVLVHDNGMVENRIVEVPPDLRPSALVEASNFLSARLVGRSIADARAEILAELKTHEARLDDLAGKVVESGLATWAGGESGASLIVRGQANLLEEIQGIEELEQVRALFSILETKEMMLNVLSLVDNAEGVQIFIGSGNQLFNVAGCALIISPYRGSRRNIIGAIGVIGPTRMNYARIIPMVDYTAKLVGELIG